MSDIQSEHSTNPQKPTLTSQLQGLKDSPEDFPAVKSALTTKFTNLSTRLHDMSIAGSKGGKTFGYGPLCETFSARSSAQDGDSINFTTQDNQGYHFSYNKDADLLTFSIKNAQLNSGSGVDFFLQGDEISYNDNGTSTVFHIVDGAWQQKISYGDPSTTPMPLQDIVQKLMQWIEQLDQFEAHVDTLHDIRTPEKIEENIAQEEVAFLPATKAISDKFRKMQLDLSTKALGQKRQGMGTSDTEKQMVHVLLDGKRIFAPTNADPYISFYYNEQEKFGGSTDGTFKYVYGNVDTDITNKIILYSDETISYVAGKNGETILLHHDPCGTDKKNPNHAIYRNLLNFLLEKRQAYTRELEDVLIHRDDKEESNPEVSELKEKLNE